MTEENKQTYQHPYDDTKCREKPCEDETYRLDLDEKDKCVKCPEY